MSDEILVLRKDLIAVCKALLVDSVEYFDSDYDCGWSCNHCDTGYNWRIEDLKHQLDCPVLVAMDILPKKEAE